MIKHKCFICLKDINNNSSPKICYCKGSIKSHDKCLRKYIIKYKKINVIFVNMNIKLIISNYILYS